MVLFSNTSMRCLPCLLWSVISCFALITEYRRSCISKSVTAGLTGRDQIINVNVFGVFVEDKQFDSNLHTDMAPVTGYFCLHLEKNLDFCSTFA